MEYLRETRGGVCAECGSTERLSFHHTDPREKDFSICEETDLPIEELLAEIEKCVLLCYRCHFGWHAGFHFSVGFRIPTRARKAKLRRQAPLDELIKRAAEERVFVEAYRTYFAERKKRLSWCKAHAKGEYNKTRTKARKELKAILSCW